MGGGRAAFPIPHITITQGRKALTTPTSPSQLDPASCCIHHLWFQRSQKSNQIRPRPPTVHAAFTHCMKTSNTVPGGEAFVTFQTPKGFVTSLNGARLSLQNQATAQMMDYQCNCTKAHLILPTPPMSCCPPPKAPDPKFSSQPPPPPPPQTHTLKEKPFYFSSHKKLFPFLNHKPPFLSFHPSKHSNISTHSYLSERKITIITRVNSVVEVQSRKPQKRLPENRLHSFTLGDRSQTRCGPNSPPNAYRSVTGHPIVHERAQSRNTRKLASYTFEETESQEVEATCA